ncbi:DUF4055 domain-containing protein [bacterium]|nr:DUF4055 domain-containing protein [bacterium]
MVQLTKPTKAIKKSVADPSDSYQSLKPLWKKSRAVLQGQENVKAHDEFIEHDYSNLLIPFSPSMTQRQYDFYKSEAELPGLTAQYCKVLISALLRKESKLNLPDELPDDAADWIKTNFTLDGRSLFNFLDNALWEELQTSRAWVYVDYPSLTEEQYDMLTPEERDMIKPYPVLIEAENVINVQTDTHPVTRQKTLSRWVTRYLVKRYTADNPWHPNYVDTVADHYLDEGGNLVIDYYEHPDTNNEIKVLNGEIKQDYEDRLTEIGFTLVNTITPTMFGERLKRIPAWPLNGQFEPVEPVLLPLIDREIALYNKVSRRNHLLYGAATYTPVVQSDMTDEEFEDIVNAGLGTWLRVRKDESITVLETPTAALADMERAITATVEEMAKMGIRMLSPEQAASGVALEIRNASQTAQLGTLNAKVSGTMREVIAFMINWKYNTDYTSTDIEFEMSSDFAPMVGGEGAMRLVSEWYQYGIISRSTFINIAKYNDFLPADYNDEEAVTEIQTDPIVNNSQGADNVNIIE